MVSGTTVAGSIPVGDAPLKLCKNMRDTHILAQLYTFSSQSVLARSSQKPVKQTEEEKSWRPLADKNAPITLIHPKQDGRSENRTNRSPIPGFFRNLVRECKVLFLCLWRSCCGIFVRKFYLRHIYSYPSSLFHVSRYMYRSYVPVKQAPFRARGHPVFIIALFQDTYARKQKKISSALVRCDGPT